MFREDLNPFLKIESSFDDEILPSGILSEPRTSGELVDLVERHVGKEEARFFSERLEVFKEFKATVRAGAKGINGYLAIEFEGKDIVAAESIQKNNATYIFSKQNYQENIMRDKQDVRTNGKAIKILNHNDNWEQNVRRFLNEH